MSHLHLVLLPYTPQLLISSPHVHPCAYPQQLQEVMVCDVVTLLLRHHVFHEWRSYSHPSFMGSPSAPCVCSYCSYASVKVVFMCPQSCLRL